MSTEVDQVLRAFLDVFGGPDGHVVFRRRGTSRGYVHVVPSGFEPTDPRHRFVAVELHNGTVCVTAELKDALGANARPGARIEEHPTGHSAGPNYGRFKWALTHPEILTRWKTERAFAEDVRTHMRALRGSDVIESDDGD